MTTSIPSTLFTTELLYVLTETFESVQGIYLDKGTSLIETLAGLSAEQASQVVGSQCASIAAHVTHVCFYLDVLDHYMKTGQDERVDWGEIWRTVRAVNIDEWARLQTRLRQAYQRLQAAIPAYESWDVEYSIAGAIGVVAHTAYHLGEIRRASCVVVQ